MRNSRTFSTVRRKLVRVWAKIPLPLFIFRMKSKTSHVTTPKGHSKKLIRIGKRSAQKAVKESKAMNLTITYMEEGVLYCEKPDGTKVEYEKEIK
jgi:hypothetical protein